MYSAYDSMTRRISLRKKKASRKVAWCCIGTGSYEVVNVIMELRNTK